MTPVDVQMPMWPMMGKNHLEKNTSSKRTELRSVIQLGDATKRHVKQWPMVSHSREVPRATTKRTQTPRVAQGAEQPDLCWVDKTPLTENCQAL